MKKFSFFAAALAVIFSFASCNLLSSDKISETGRAEFSLSPELARAVIDSLQADEGESNPHMKQNLSIEVKLTGEYSAEKSVQIDVTDLDIQQKSEDLKSKIEDKLTSQTIIFDAIPAGKRVSADVKVYLVSSHGDIQMKKDILVKGKSDPVTISAGDNLISVALSIVYRSYPVTFNLSFEKAGGDFTTCRSVDLYAVKADSDTVLKFFRTFAEGQGSSTDFYNILNGHLNPDCFAEAYWYKDSENKDIYQTAVTEDAMTLSGKIYLPFDEKIIVVALANFTGATDEGLYYICHVPGSSMDEVMSHAFVPDAGGNTVELKSNKLAVSTQYALYQTAQIEGQTQYMYFLSSSPSDIGMSVGTSTVNTFCFDEDGYFYTLKLIDESWYIQSNNPECSSVKATVTYSGEGTVDVTSDSSPVIFVDRKTNVLYMAISGGGANTTVVKYTDLISSGATTNSVAYGFSIPDSTYELNPGQPMTIYNGVVYAVAIKSYSPNKLFKVDLSNTNDVSEIDLSSDTDIASMLASASITDLICQDESLYVLISDKNVSCSNNSYAFYSRGALIKYDLITKSIEKYGWTDSSLPIENTYTYVARRTNAEEYPGVLWEDEYGNPVLAKADKIRQLESIDPTGSSSFNIYSPANAEISFYAPSKFIAIKPKKLVIADDGYAFYTDALGAWRVKNVNRVVTVDLDSFIFTCTNVGVNFSGNISTNLTNNNGSYFDYMPAEAKSVYNSQTKDEISGSIYCSGGSTGSSISWAGEGSLPAIRLDD